MENKSKNKISIIVIIILLTVCLAYVIIDDFKQEKTDNTLIKNIINSDKTNIEKIDLFLNNKLSENSKPEIFINKYYAGDLSSIGSTTYDVWLYTKEKPSSNQVKNFVKVLGSGLTEILPDHYFNFKIFPESSIKTPGDSLPYDSYIEYSVSWRKGKVIFPEVDLF